MPRLLCAREAVPPKKVPAMPSGISAAVKPDQPTPGEGLRGHMAALVRTIAADIRPREHPLPGTVGWGILMWFTVMKYRLPRPSGVEKPRSPSGESEPFLA